MTIYNDTLSEYITSLFAGEDEALQRIREELPGQGLPAIAVSPEEGRFLQFLVRATGAVKALEIGALGGYSGVWIARGLAPGGRLLTLEREARHARVAAANFERAGVADQVEILEGNAHDLLPALSAEGPFDFVFIDAEKQGYPAYFEWAIANTRIGGVIAAHNAFRQGSIAPQEGEEEDEAVRVMRAFNENVASRPDVISTIFPAGDGTVVAVKVSEGVSDR